MIASWEAQCHTSLVYTLSVQYWLSRSVCTVVYTDMLSVCTVMLSVCTVILSVCTVMLSVCTVMSVCTSCCLSVHHVVCLYIMLSVCTSCCLSVHHVVCVYMQGASVVSGVSLMLRVEF